MSHRNQLSRAFATQLLPLGRAWQQLAEQALSELGLSNSAAWALVHLARLGQGVRQGELARSIGITEASLVRTLQQLDGGNLVQRVPDADDRRANCLFLTTEGEKIAKQADVRLMDLRADLLAGISDLDLEFAVHLLDGIAQRVAEKRATS